MDLRAFLAVVRRHHRLIAATAVGVVLVALVLDTVRGPRYSAETTMRLRTADVVATGADAIEYADRLQATFADLVATRTFRSDVARELGWDEAPDVALVSSGSELLRLRATAPDASDAIAAADAAAERLQRILRSQMAPELGALAVIDAAGPEAAREGPGTLAVAGLGAVTGLAAGLGLALARENLRDETTTGAEAAALLGAPFLGAVSRPGRGRRSPDTAEADAAALRLAEEDGNVWSVLGDQAGPVRLVSGELARATARLGVRAVVVEHEHAGPPRPDMADVVAGRATLDAAVAVEDGLPRVRLRGGGPDRLLRPGSVDKAMVRLREEFDLVVVESPRAGSGASWLVLTSVVRFVVVVLAGERAARDDLRELRRAVEAVGGRITGVLVAPGGRGGP